MKIKVIIPTFNEEKTIAKVVGDFKKQLPSVEIIVYDGNSTDRTASIAKSSNTKVMFQESTGKGNAIREIFQKIDSDIYLIVDGDDTYPVDKAKDLIKPIIEKKADLVVGARIIRERGSMKALHRFGNFVITSLTNKIFKTKLKDILSGYRAISKKVVKDVNIISEGFDVETEMTIKTLIERHRIMEIPVKYSKRPEGSTSKLKSFRHGYLIVLAIIMLFRDYRPMLFFSFMSLILIIASFVTGYVVFVDFLTTGITARLGTALLTAILFLAGVQIFALGLTLDSVNKGFRDIKQSITKRDKS